MVSDVSPPRFDDPDADIILRSCDHQEFRVLKLYIVKVSPLLKELIQSASSSHDANATTSLPSIQLSDSGIAISSLLSFVLPIPPVLPSTIEQTMILLSAAQKYQMDSILSHIRAVIASQDPPFIRSETAFQVYSLAQLHELRPEALHGARTTLTSSFKLEDLEDEIGTTSGAYLRELWKYHNRVWTYLTADLAIFKATGIPRAITRQSCSYGTLTWLGEYLSSVAESPALFDITEFYLFLSRHINASHPHCTCVNIPSKAIHAFWMALTNVVHGCMTKASVDSLRDCMTEVIIHVIIARIRYHVPRTSDWPESHLPADYVVST
jgi:hypothetical protein